MEADEEDIDAVEAHLMKWFEVKVLALIGGKSSGEVGFLKRVLRYDAVAESFFWCSGECHVQDTATTLQLTGRSHNCKTAHTLGTRGTGATLPDGDKKLGENETAVFRSVLGSVMYVAQDRPGILCTTKTVASFMKSPTKSAKVKLKLLVRRLVDVYGDSDCAVNEERKRSTTGVAEIFGGHPLDAASATQSLVALSSAEAEFHACNRGWSANVPLPDRGGLRGDSTSVER